jgi:hypothetical protein
MGFGVRTGKPPDSGEPTPLFAADGWQAAAASRLRVAGRAHRR